LNEYSFEELLYLVRAYLETTRYEEAAQAQLALERKMINFEEFSFEKMGNLAISRMIFFAFLGWKEEFEELQQQKEEGIERLPAEIRDFWHGVCVFNSGDFTQGEELMGKAMRSCDKNEEAESWLPFMRKRFFGLQEQKEFLSSRLLVKLKDIKQLYAPKFHEIFIESRQSSSDTERSETCTNILAWLTMIISVALMYSVGIDDLVSLIRIGANSSVLVQQGDYFRLFTSLFIHIGWVHLFMNVIALKFFGPPVESIAGWQGFLGIYFFSGLIGGLSGVLFGQSLSAGASAAVLGLLSVSIIFEIFRVRGIEKVSSKNTFSTLVFILIINLVIGVVEPGVDNSAHMGGLAGGALIALFFVPFLKNGYLPRMIKILSVIFVMVFSLGSITQVLMKSEHDFYPANTVNFKTVANASGTLSLQIPELWDLDESLTSFRELTAQGPFRERLVIMLSVNDADENTVIQEHINARTREIENTKNLNLKIRKGPDKIDFLKKNIYEVRWLLESGESPVSVVDYLVFDNEMFYLIRFFLGTSQHEYYDNIMLKVLHSFSSPMFDLHEKSIEEQ
jgi:membrane associated rhomboid family serine protease